MYICQSHMKNSTFPYWLSLVIYVFSTTSCRHEEFNIPETDVFQTLGKKLENPYTLKVMQQAWDNIQPGLYSQGRINDEDLTLEPTHYYIKFMPKTEVEFELLQADTTLDLYNYPLEYEINEGLNNYRDPEIPEGQPNYQYTAFPLHKPIPNIDYEIISEIFIPEDSPIFATARIDDPCIPILLSNEAMRLTNNLDYILPEDDCGNGGGGSSGGVSCSYCPQGTMRVWDDEVQGYVPIVGLKVKARRFLKTRDAITDANGKYIIRGIRGKVQYSFKWKRYDFTIRDKFLDAAETIGPNKDGWWSVNFKGGVSQFHATIFRAAHHYYYGNIKGLRRPPQNGFFGNNLKIRAKNEDNPNDWGSHCGPCNFLGLTTEIWIYNMTLGSGNYVDLYATTIHELAHASHWAMDEVNYENMCDGGVVFCSGDLKVAESWARGVQWELTRMIYPNYSGGATKRPNYTQVVIDMIDAAAPIDQITGMPVNQNKGSEDLRFDDVTGYTIRQIEDALIGEKKWNGWRDNIKNKYNNATENKLDALFDYWN